MKLFFKKIGLILLDGFHPFFSFFAKRKKKYFEDLRSSFTDPYHSAMISRFSKAHEFIFKPYFEKVRTDPAEIQTLQDLSHKGTLVYVMKKRGQLEYSFFNHLFLKEDIPLARFANASRTLFWRPFREICRSLLARLDLYYQRGLLEDPIQSGYLEKHISNGNSALLNLKVSQEFIFGASEDPLEFIPPLIHAARKSSKPVYLVTQQFLYDRHPDKVRKSWVDLLFGEKSNPGMIRKLIMFMMSYRKKATVRFGEALDLQNFIQDNPDSNQTELSTKLKEILLSRLHIERKSITGPVLKPTEHFYEKILRNPIFKEAIEQLSDQSGNSIIEIRKEASRYFREIAAKVNYNFVDACDIAIRWMFNNIYDGLDVDTEGLAKIKAIAGKHPVVLVPSHKSHIDYLLVSYLFYNYDLTLPHVCAGINLKFWPAGPLIRRGGGFFIRRSFKGNDLYKLVLEQYLSALIKEGHAVEFFIEGTRSRTGKLLKPKMGILSMLMNSWLEGAAEDIYFVPISINYEKILEAKSYVKEIKGSEKEKENVAGVIKAREKLGKKHGKVFIQFAEPLSLKKYFQEKGVVQKRSSLEECRKYIEEFAYVITYNINKKAVVTATSLVSMALLSMPQKGISESDILNRVKPLKKYLEFKKANISNLLNQKQRWSVLESLQKLTFDGLIERHEDFREKFYTLDSLKRPALEFHKNNIIHFFVSLVCLSKIFQMTKSRRMTFTEIEKRYETFKTLLRHDFTFSQRAKLRDHILKVIEFYQQEKILTFDSSNETVSFHWDKAGKTFDLYSSLLDSFFESYYLTLLFIEHISFEKMDRKKLEEAILDKGKNVYLRGDLKYPEALSRFNITNALLVFKDLGLLKSEEQSELTRHGDAETIAQWKKLLESILGIEDSLNKQALRENPTFDSDSNKPQTSSGSSNLQ